MYEIRDRFDGHWKGGKHPTKAEAEKALDDWMNPTDTISEDPDGHLWIEVGGGEVSDLYARRLDAPRGIGAS